MLLIPCPHCGPRNSSEFRYAGEGRGRPDVTTTTRAQWRSYLYERRNVAGEVRESWYHTFGCRRFFTVDRDTVSNAIRPVAAVEGGPRGAENEVVADSVQGSPA
ncbi:MAG: sarcosine oxidase subunit delta [Mycobacteriales bacterium]|jgi:sarcosine oxidase subunit delta